MKPTSARVLCIHPDDDMLVALTDLACGDLVPDGIQTLRITSPVQIKHKLSRHACESGDIVKLYGVPVGRASQPIAAGEAVTVHNLKHYAADPVVNSDEVAPWTPPDVSQWHSATFQGIVRADGRVGTANHWLVFPLVFCENRNVELLRDALVKPLGYANDELADFARSLLGGTGAAGVTVQRPFPNVDGVRIITHQGGCGGTRADAQALCRVLAAYADHPNVAGVTVFSLGCQNAQVTMFRNALAAQNPHFDKPCLVYEQQSWQGGEAEMMKTVVRDTLEQLALANAVRREPVSLAQLRIGVKCGGSDGFSGISANPVLGLISDRLVALGGTAVLTEFPELCGVESQLIARCVRVADRHRFVGLMRDFEARVTSAGSSFADNPSPGNIRDGLITDAMKSAGAARKGGSSPIVSVLDYGETVREPGLSLLCAPGNDVESVTALVASGVNLVLFTTGLGTPTGNPVVPVVKVASNSEVATRLHELLDFDCGPVLTGSAPEAVADALLKHIMAVASGDAVTKADRLGQHDFIFWRRDTSL